MPTLYEMMIGAGPQGPEQTAEVARMLRNREGLGMVGAISGDPILSQIGSGLVQQTGQRSEGLQKARQQNAQRSMLTDMYTNQDEVARINAAERERHNRAMEEIERMRRREAASSRGEAIREKNVERFGKRVGEYSDLLSTMTQLDMLLTPYVHKNKDGKIVPKEDIPGVGAGQTWVPAWARSTEGNEIRGRVAELRNIILKVRSGAAVTPSEAGRLDQALGLLDTANEQNFLDQYTKARELVNAAIADISASYDGEVVSTYAGRGGRIGLPDWRPGSVVEEEEEDFTVEVMP